MSQLQASPDYLPWVALGVSIFSLLFTFIFNYCLRKWQYRQEYKIKFVDQLYPLLVKEFRNVLNQYSLLWNDLTELPIVFDNLDDFFKAGRILYIKTIDENLYFNLEKIKDETEPKIKKIMEKKREAVRVTLDIWSVNITTIFESSSFNKTEIAGRVLKKSMIFIGKRDFNKINDIFEEEIKPFKEEPVRIEISSDTSRRLIEIAETQFEEMLQLDQQVSKQLDEVVKVVIEKMLSTLTKPI